MITKVFSNNPCCWKPIVAGVVCVVLVLSASGYPQGTSPAKPTAAQARGAAIVVPDAAVPFHVGETLTYDVSWSGFLSAGTATLAVKDRQKLADGRAAYDIVAEAKPRSLIASLYPLYYRLETSFDTRALVPIRASMYSEERSRKRTKTTTFVNATTIEYELKTASISRKTKTVERMTQDALSLVYALRAQTLPPTGSVAIPLTDGGETYRVTIRASGRERLKVGAGTFPAVSAIATILDAHGNAIPNRNLTFWFSDDARRFPLQVKAALPVGNFVLSLSTIAG